VCEYIYIVAGYMFVYIVMYELLRVCFNRHLAYNFYQDFYLWSDEWIRSRSAEFI